jgi:hypothetical protein
MTGRSWFSWWSRLCTLCGDVWLHSDLSWNRRCRRVTGFEANSQTLPLKELMTHRRKRQFQVQRSSYIVLSVTSLLTCSLTLHNGRRSA